MPMLGVHKTNHNRQQAGWTYATGAPFAKNAKASPVTPACVCGV